jgi:hypothetical protein
MKVGEYKMLTAMKGSNGKKAYKDQLRPVQKLNNESRKGINSTLLVVITSFCVI